MVDMQLVPQKDARRSDLIFKLPRAPRPREPKRFEAES
jgi:hypothetical protein